jgi:hypothetical protein
MRRCSGEPGTGAPVRATRRSRNATLAQSRKEKDMKRFLAVYTGSPAAMSRWETMTEAQRNERQAAGVAAWKQWAEANKAAIVEMGGPLSRTKLVSAAGVSDIRNSMAAFTIVQAESQDEAARLFLGHPHFTIFPGEGVEVMECLPLPAM